MNAKEAQAGQCLARMVATGLCTLDDLDKPSQGYREIEDDRYRSANPVKQGDWPGYVHGGPTMRYPDAGTRRPVRNLAREWINAFPEQWEALRTGTTPENTMHGTAYSREVARERYTHYDRLKDQGYDFNAGLHNPRIDFPEVIDGPIGYRPDWLKPEQPPQPPQQETQADDEQDDAAA